MRVHILALLGSIIWAAVTGSASLVNLIFGFCLSALALWVVRGEIGAAGYRRRLGRILSLALLFFRELALSAWRVAILVTRRRIDIRPGVFAFPLTVDRDAEITLLANLITLTPGTLSVDVSEDRKTLYVHAIHLEDVEAARSDIANGFERKIMEAFR